MSLKILIVLIINLVVFTFVISTAVPQTVKVEKVTKQRVGLIKEETLLEKNRYYTADELINLIYVRNDIAVKYNGVVMNSSSNYVDVKKELGSFSYKIIDMNPDFVEVVR